MTPEDKEAVKKEIIEELKGADDEARRAAFAGLKRELVEEIEKEDLKKEVLDELRPKESSTEGFLKHPASLLVIGFLLTTLFGTIITSCWKYREWENEQDYLKTQSRCERERLTRTEEIRQKNDVKDEIIRRVAETNTAAEEVLKYLLLDPARREKEAADRTGYWKEASRNWRINSKILNQRLVFRFGDPRVDELFNEITKYRSWVGNTIDNQQEALGAGKAICAPRVYKANECMSHVTGELMPDMVKIMTAEISGDEKRLREAQCVAGPTPQPSAATPTPAATAGKDKGGQQPKENACEDLLKIDCEKQAAAP